MAKRGEKTVLFLDAGNGRLGRDAELVFNSVAARMGLPWRATSGMTADDLDRADRVVALNPDETPTAPGEVEHWRVTDGPEAPAEIEREVMGLVARILGGSASREEARPAETPAKEPAKNPLTLKVGRETKGRRGKGVTTVFDIPLDEESVRELAATLKQRCGTGGTVKNGRIEIQGDQRERIIAELEKLGYRVKRVGG